MRQRQRFTDTGRFADTSRSLVKDSLHAVELVTVSCICEAVITLLPMDIEVV